MEGNGTVMTLEELANYLEKLAGDLVQAQNQLHGIRHGGPAKREIRDIESALVRTIALIRTGGITITPIRKDAP